MFFKKIKKEPAQDIVLACEKYSQVIEEMKPLLRRHWEEIARNKDIIPFDPRYDKYAELEKNDTIRMYTVRNCGILIGYAVYFIMPHLHYKNNLWALSDIFWVDPYFRRSRNVPLWVFYAPVIKWFFRDKNRPKIGHMLFKFIEKSLKEDGITVMHTTSKCANPAARHVLEQLGHDLIEYGHAKMLKEP